MVNFYKTIDNKIQEQNELTPGCWISVISPTEDEVAYLINDLHIDSGFIRAALDDEESPRIELEDDQTLIIVDVPVAEHNKNASALSYSTMPMGIVITDHWVITICLRPHQVISEVTDGMVKNITTHLRTRFLLTLLLRVASRFLLYLKQIDKISSYTEQMLHKSMRNKELFQLLGLQKSLVFFSTSLKANEVTLEKIMRGRIIKLYEEDEDILEDVLIEVKQAIEMCNIYSSILTGTMDCFASIISNNLNIVMKVLTSLTIVMAIPTIITSLYGMNVPDLPLPSFWFPVFLSILSMGAAAFVLVKKGMFK